MTTHNVPFNKPVDLPESVSAVQAALSAGHLSGNGPYTKKCEKVLEQRLERKTRIVTSATHALETMGLLTELKPGDEVILPSFTFVSTANAFALRGATLRFADNDEFGNIKPTEIERLLSKKTKAVVAVHYAGASADLDAILELCAKHGVPLFEDAAQAIGAKYKQRPLGTIGALGCFSFHDTKNIGCGEGGALICGDEFYAERAEIIREKGTNRSQFLRGLVDKYTWVDIGSSYVLSDLNAALLLPQLERLDAIHAKRKSIWEHYKKELTAPLAKRDTHILETPSHNTPNFHMLAVVFADSEMRDSYIAFMREQGVSCPFHYVALHTSPFGQTFSNEKPEQLPGCDRLSQRLARLPLYYNMTEKDQAYVIEKTLAWLNHRS